MMCSFEAPCLRLTWVVPAPRGTAVFFIFIMIFSLAFGFAMAVLLPGNVKNPASHIFSSEPIWSTFWGLFGNDNLDSIEEYLGFDSYVTNAVAPVMLWFYQLLATIVLVNLLIAQMSNTYETVMQDSKKRWLFARADIIMEFKDSKVRGTTSQTPCCHSMPLPRWSR
jgi:hypothetical protein